MSEPLIGDRLLSELKVVDLKSELDKRNLSKSGNKNVLQERLRQFLLEEENLAESNGVNEQNLTAPPPTASNPLVAEYLAKQQQALEQARKVAEEARAAVSPDIHDQKSEQQPKSDATESSEQKPTESENESSKSGESDNGDELDVSMPQEMEEDQMDELEKLREAAKNSKKRCANTADLTTEESKERKRKWGSRAVKKNVVAISTDSLKDIMKEAEDVQVELDYDDEEVPSNKMKRTVVAEREESGDEVDLDENKSNRIVIERRSSFRDNAENGRTEDEEQFLTSDGLKRTKDVSPARYPANPVLHIRCLTRPFTQKGLFDLLEKFGTVIRDQFWIDSIKTNCLVKYETDKQASEARSRLHNVVWPLSNPKCLRVDFASQEVLDRHLEGDSRRRDASTLENNNREAIGREEFHRRRSSPEEERRKPRDQASRTEREWDRGKQFGAESPPRRRRSSKTPPKRQMGNDSHSEQKQPAKLLDDLFQKTKTTPSIYWISLTEDQALTRKQQKNEERAKQAELRRRPSPKRRSSRSPRNRR